MTVFRTKRERDIVSLGQWTIISILQYLGTNARQKKKKKKKNGLRRRYRPKLRCWFQTFRYLTYMAPFG